MSNSVFPSTRYAPGVTKRPQFSTSIQQAASLREVRASLSAYPVYGIDLEFPMLSQAEFEELCGFFLSRRGSFDSFLFSDPSDNAVTLQQFSEGDGSTTQFQLIRTLGGFSEPCQNISAVTAVTIDSVPTSAYTIGSTGIVTFSSAPADNSNLKWSGEFYHRCRFENDATQFDQFYQRLYKTGKISLRGAPGNKI